MRQGVDNTCLCNVKQTAWSFVAKTLNANKFNSGEPCGVKRLQMSEGVSWCCGLHYRAIPGEGVFFPHVSIMSTWIWLQTRALLLTDFIYKHLQTAQTSILKVQQLLSASVLLWETICYNKVRHGRVCMRDVSCVWVIFDVTNMSPVDSVWDVWHPVHKF